MFVSRLWALGATLGLLGCAAPHQDSHPPRADLVKQLNQLLPAEAILLGEQHDAPDHQRIHRDVVEALATQGALAALVLEMAEHRANRLTSSPRAAQRKPCALPCNGTTKPGPGAPTARP